MDPQYFEGFVNMNNVTGAYVVAGRCAKCGKPVGEEFVLALPAPYHCLIHAECVAFFNFLSRQWPHPMPAAAYVKRRRRQSSPPLLDMSQ